MSKRRGSFLKKLKLALVGKGIKHSKSQQMYEELLGTSVDYTLLDYEQESQIPNLSDLLLDYQGVSITAPYKHVFIPQCEVDEFFKDLNAINCTGRFGDTLRGTNTDFLALENLTQNYFQNFEKIILLGDGAMARITVALFEKNNIQFEQFSRKLNPDFFEKDFVYMGEGKESFLIINSCGRKYEFNQPLSSNTVFYDYNYAHEHHTNFFKKSDGKYIDGLELLKSQARYALKFWGIIS